MPTKTNIRSITWLESHAAEALRDLSEGRRPMVLTQNGEARAVLVDVETYEERERALMLLKLVAQSDADVAAGRTVPQEDAFERAGRLLDDAP